MYYLRFYENASCVTVIGGAVETMKEAMRQLDRLKEGLGATDMKKTVGIQWLRAGITPCCIAITDEKGDFITLTDR